MLVVLLIIIFFIPKHFLTLTLYSDIVNGGPKVCKIANVKDQFDKVEDGLSFLINPLAY